MKKLLPFIFFFFNVILFAQEVTVINFETQRPIKNCTIYGENLSKSVSTNKNGKADVSLFSSNEIITFNHLSYIEVEVLKRHLVKTKHIVFLHKKSESLDEIILSASRQKENRNRIAEQIEVHLLEDIEKIAPQTSADLLANFSGVRIQKSQFGGGSPVLRGMEANRILLVVDGVRMNNAIYRSGHLQNSITVSPSVLERAEVIFGPSSIVYGSDALGGVIHYYTKTPKLNKEKKVDFNFMSRYGSAVNEITNQGSVELSFKKWGSLTSFSHTDFGDLRMGKKRNHGYSNWGKVVEYSNNTDSFYNPNPVLNQNQNIQKNTGYYQSDFLQKFYFKFSEKTNLTFNFQYSTSSNINRFDKLNEYSNGDLKFAEWKYGPQKRFLISTQLAIQPNKKWLNRGAITVAFQDIKESRIQRKFNSIDRLHREEDVKVFSLNGDFFVPLAKKLNRNVSYGFELAHNDIISNAYGKKLAVLENKITSFSDTFTVQSRYPDGGSSYMSTAVYTSYRQDINKNGTLNTGIRYTNTKLKAKWEDQTFLILPESNISLNNSALTATIGYIYKPLKNLQLNTVVSSGFRSPNIDDIGKIREKNGRVSIPNTALKPEYLYSIEVGVLKYLNNRKFNIGLNVYYSLLNNYIARKDFLINGSSTIIYDGDQAVTYANVNHKNAYIIGSTFSFKGQVSEFWKTSGSFTYTKGKAYDTKIALSSIPPFFGNIEIGYSKNRYKTALNFRFNGAKKATYNLIEGIDNIEQTPYNNTTSEYEGSPSWNTLNFFSKYKVSKSIELQFMIDNIFDNHYKEFASSISAPGRNFSFSIFFN